MWQTIYKERLSWFSFKKHQSNKQFYTCDDCGRSYTLKHNLQKQMKDNHQYSIPGQGFATTSQNMHNKNNVKCKYCAKVYSTKQMATKHEQNYHKPSQTSSNVINFGSSNFGIFEDQIFDTGDLRRTSWLYFWSNNWANAQLIWQNL